MDGRHFSQTLIRGLTDKIYDRRKAAALDIEKLVRDNESEPERITGIIDALVQDFVYSNNANARYGGLIGLAATAIALGPSVAGYLDIIVPPILSCFSNQDQKVRYYACESMYNIAKVAKGEVLRFFNSVFDALCKLSADSEQTVKSGAELLDRLIKDVVSELSTTYVSPYQQPLNPLEDTEQQELLAPASLPRNTAFSLPRFIPLLRQRIYVQNSNARQYLVSWIAVLDSIPDLELVSFLPEFLDGLIQCLNDPSGDVRTSTKSLLAGFLQDIRQAATTAAEVKRYMRESSSPSSPSPSSSKENESPTLDQTDIDVTLSSTTTATTTATATTAAAAEVAGVFMESDGHGKGTYFPGQGIVVQYARIVEILIPHLSSPEQDIQRTALEWINEFTIIAKDIIIQFTPEIIKAVLPSLAHHVPVIKEFATATNQSLQKLVMEAPVTVCLSPNATATSTSDSLISSSLSTNNPLSPIQQSAPDPFDYQATLTNLRLQFLNEHENTRVASLEWLLMLHKKAPHKILVSDDGTFPALLKTLSDPSEEVVCRDLQLLAQISSYSDHEYFRHFMTNLLLLFSTDRRLLETRGSLIIRQLCLSLDPDRIYCTIADILEMDEDLEFASIMVQNLNIILITATELSDVRKRLRNLDHKDGQQLFVALYKSWCHNTVATLSLCLLAQAYEHAANMLQVFADLEITVNMLIQIDKLVQLLESPVFTYLRMQLLEPERYPYLFKCLYGILMLLPQSSAFSTLRNRLSSVSSLGFLNVMPKSTSTGTESALKRPSLKTANKNEEPAIKFQELLQHFKSVQTRHERQRRQSLQNLTKFSASVRGRRSRLNYDVSGSNGQNSMGQEESSKVGRVAMTTLNDRSSKASGSRGSTGGSSRIMGGRKTRKA
ncbi:hypothetical protein [Absidia glauca]|uniref:Vacuolar protein 14 C-terminal Fig4-binding domain-containing protein n=1 Tax=Absidia glauca TaxID=4829 RepID=A0A168SPI3_ABSGL|nr:hypothetical protein [Absidia glauca]